MNTRSLLIGGIFFLILLVVLYLVLATRDLPEDYQTPTMSGAIHGIQ